MGRLYSGFLAAALAVDPQWYQNDKNVKETVDAAKAFGVTGVSLWRLGIVPQGRDWNWDGLLGKAR